MLDEITSFVDFPGNQAKGETSPDFTARLLGGDRSLDTTLVLNAEGAIVYRDEFPSTYKTLKAALAQAGI